MTDTKEDKDRLTTFRTEEDGAVTADWVVLAAAVVLLAIPLMVTIRASTQTATNGIAEDVVASSNRDN
ncbi:hypothetical protein [Paragemmobacter ruber]|uniref:Pilus assembly protein n=1 Tax=Paragemmobacter ruber TaxID=1985673 RepID=A0ABW9Y774_9RHOB|nr:hypothetical protein [Rhodobacter ruber]NBE08039.1 hypothetical protein [Rhodobacter ruber]